MNPHHEIWGTQSPLLLRSSEQRYWRPLQNRRRKSWATRRQSAGHPSPPFSEVLATHHKMWCTPTFSNAPLAFGVPWIGISFSSHSPPHEGRMEGRSGAYLAQRAGHRLPSSASSKHERLLANKDNKPHFHALATFPDGSDRRIILLYELIFTIYLETFQPDPTREVTRWSPESC